MRKQQAAASPSWKTLRSRSSSLPRIKIRPKVGGVWANSWLPGSSSPQKVQQNSIWEIGSPSRRSLSPPHRRRPLRRTPVLTLTLIKLDEQLQQFCQFLKDPSYENVASACALLDSSVATASPVSSEKGSPASYVGSPSLGSSPGSPSNRSPRSPLRNWLTGTQAASPTSGGSPTSSSALALEGEWEKTAVYLFILAGAEAVYADMGHVVEDGSVARNLIALYEAITNELHLVRQTLCDPFLMSEEETLEQQQQQQQHLQNPPSGSTIAMYTERASSVAASLHALASITRTRCELIQLHLSLWEGGTSFGDLARSFQDIIPNLPSEGARAQPMCEAIEREVGAWMCIAETAFSLERCRFAETILSAQKTKARLDLSSKSCMQVWLCKTLRRMISIMPVFFDRIETFSKPLYGFNQNVMYKSTPEQDANRLGPTQHLEDYVLQFLQQQEKAGGPSIAVSVVLDAVSTSNLRIERGFALTEASPAAETVGAPNGPDSALSQWPAVYMRSTVHGLSNLASGGGILRGMRRTAGRKEARVGRAGSRSHEDDPTSAMRQPSSILRSWSNDASPSIGKEAAKLRHQEKRLSLNVLEYAPESGTTASSWPHSAWNKLVAVLAGQEDDQLPDPPVKVEPPLDRGSFGDMEVDLFSSIRNWPGLSAATTTSTDSSPLSSPASPISRLVRQEVQTSFYVSALSDFLWLVLMVKGEEESLWHRRRSRSALEEEAREFLNTMASQLRVADWFSPRHIHRLRQGIFEATSATSSHGHFRREHGLVFEMRAERAWDDKDMQDFLKCIKEIFGLRAPRRPIIGPLYSMSSYGLSFVSKRGSPRNRSTGTPPPSISLEKSAAALFLGPELMNSFGE